MSWLISSLSKEVLPQFIGLTYSYKWSNLAATFEAPSHSLILQLQIQRQNLKMGDYSISSFRRQAKYIADELTAPILSISF